MILKTMTMQQRSNQTKLKTDNYEWSRPDQLCIVSRGLEAACSMSTEEMPRYCCCSAKTGAVVWTIIWIIGWWVSCLLIQSTFSLY